MRNNPNKGSQVELQLPMRNGYWCLQAYTLKLAHQMPVWSRVRCTFGYFLEAPLFRCTFVSVKLVDTTKSTILAYWCVALLDRWHCHMKLWTMMCANSRTSLGFFCYLFVAYEFFGCSTTISVVFTAIIVFQFASSFKLLASTRMWRCRYCDPSYQYYDRYISLVVSSSVLQ